jgi:hypothetical protein
MARSYSGRMDGLCEFDGKAYGIVRGLRGFQTNHPATRLKVKVQHPGNVRRRDNRYLNLLFIIDALANRKINTAAGNVD